MDTINPAPKAKKLKDVCHTRWIERIDSYIVFLELISAVHKTLQAMTSPVEFSDLGDWNWNCDQTQRLFVPVRIIIILNYIHYPLEVLSNLRGLTFKLQMEAIDVLYVHKQVYKCVTKLGKDLNGEGFELNTPRLSKWQSHRANLDSQTTEDYYRVILFNEPCYH